MPGGMRIALQSTSIRCSLGNTFTAKKPTQKRTTGIVTHQKRFRDRRACSA